MCVCVKRFCHLQLHSCMHLVATAGYCRASRHLLAHFASVASSHHLAPCRLSARCYHRSPSVGPRGSMPLPFFAHFRSGTRASVAPRSRGCTPAVPSGFYLVFPDSHPLPPQCCIGPYLRLSPVSQSSLLRDHHLLPFSLSPSPLSCLL